MARRTPKGPDAGPGRSIRKVVEHVARERGLDARQAFDAVVSDVEDLLHDRLHGFAEGLEAMREERRQQSRDAAKRPRPRRRAATQAQDQVYIDAARPHLAGRRPPHDASELARLILEDWKKRLPKTLSRLPKHRTIRARLSELGLPGSTFP